MNDVANKLRSFIKENFLFGMEMDFADDDSLLERGIVDSTGVLELITHLENEFEITIESDELTPENLDSISNLEQFVGRKLQEVHAGT